MYVHKRKTKKQYAGKNRGDIRFTCNLCDGLDADQIVRTTAHFFVVRNRVAYDIWEHHQVLDHLMVVPKRHIAFLKEFLNDERLEFFGLCSEYEEAGYSVYARGFGSPRRSAKHQHTHLLRIAPEVARAGVYLKKPYVNLYF